VPRFINFPTGVKSGSYQHSFDLTDAASYNPAFVTAEGSVAAAEAALEAGAASGAAYLNIHTDLHPSGEIRGFLVLAPEPATFVFTGLGLAGALLLRKRLAQR
jgi:hypothetical protein